VCVCVRVRVCVCVRAHILTFICTYVHNVQQKSSGLKFCTSHSRSDVTYICHHNSIILLSPYLCICGILWMVTIYFPPTSLESSLTGDSGRYKLMNQPSAVETGEPFSIGAPFWEHGGGWGSFTGYFERKVRFCFYQGMCKRRLWKWASHHRGPIGEPVGGLIYQGL